MRVLILSCNTGEGHNSCGKALSEMFIKQNIPCRMDDAFRFLSPSISRMVTVGFTFMYRHLPGVFRFGYIRLTWFCTTVPRRLRSESSIQTVSI